MYSSSAVDCIKEYNVQGIVENTILETIEKVGTNDSIQTFGVVEEANNLFIKFRVIDNSMLIRGKVFYVTSAFPSEAIATPTDKLLSLIDAELSGQGHSA